MSKTIRGKFSLHRGGRQLVFGAWDFTELPGSMPAKLKPVFDYSMVGIEEIDNMAGELRASGELTESGIQARVRAKADIVLRDLAEARKTTLNAVRLNLEARAKQMRGSLRREPNDVVGELSDQERRTFLRSLKGDDRLKVLQEMMEGRRPELATAALRSERELSGLSDTAFAALQQKSLEAANPELWRSLQEDERALKQTLAAVALAEQEIKAVSGHPGAMPPAGEAEADAGTAAESEAA